MSEVVLFSEIETANGKRIGYATLNKVKALNALNIDMIRLLTPQLQAWQKDENIAAVILDGDGEKAFCAGGDVVAMYNAMKDSPGAMPASLQDFFTEEYRLDYLIHTFGKPFVVWGNGIVMGGGLGMMCGGSHRIVTATSRIAMPEISIGLYPDVGGSYFLNRMPGGCGLFLGLTGASINAMDAIYLKLADHFIPHDEKLRFIDGMAAIDWGNTQSLNHEKLSTLCNQFQQQHQALLPKGNIKAHQEMIDSVTSHESVVDVVDAILAMDTSEDKWLSRAQKTLKAGSPITMNIVAQQMLKGKSMSLADCFRMELTMSCFCGKYGEFQEGVRALLIDKDNAPDWRFKSVSDVPETVTQEFFTSLWDESSHPLAQLGK